MNEVEAFRSLAYIVGVGAAVPIVLGLLPRVRLAEVVLLLAGGMAIGENGLGLAHAGAVVSFVSQPASGCCSCSPGSRSTHSGCGRATAPVR